MIARMRFAFALALALVLCAAGERPRIAPALASGSAPALEPAPEPEPEPVTATATDAAPTRTARVTTEGICHEILYPGKDPQFVAKRDVVTSFVTDGDDLLAIVNRSPLYTLPPDYAPPDLVEVWSGKPATVRECELKYGACLRRDAAVAFKTLIKEMSKKGFLGRLESAFRSYRAQCGTFYNWSQREGAHFCGAIEQSALPGHSQHQLGTTVDLFTEDWAADGKELGKSSFRDGFACTHAGQWLAENAWRYGFVLPYPIHPDDRQPTWPCQQRWDIGVPVNPRTGYRNEPWHIRYIGEENAARYHEDWLASGPGTPDEITLEQWLRRRRGLAADAELPVCDGCGCGACATLAGKRASPCAEDVLALDDSGNPVAATEEPELLEVKLGPAQKPPAIAIDVRVRVPVHTLTQPPVAPVYATEDATFESLVPYRNTKPHHYAELAGAWRIGIARGGADGGAWPWRASLARGSLARTFNRANLLLPAATGDGWFRVVLVPGDAESLRVTLLRDGAENGTKELPLRRP